MSPGVHTIAALTLTDIESGYSINLRCVISQVVFSYSSDITFSFGEQIRDGYRCSQTG